MESCVSKATFFPKEINIFNCNQIIYIKPSMKKRDFHLGGEKSGLQNQLEKIISSFSQMSIVKSNQSNNEDVQADDTDDDLKRIIRSVNKNIVKLNKICPANDKKNKLHKSASLPFKKRYSEDFENRNNKKCKKVSINKEISVENSHITEYKGKDAILVKLKRNINDTYKIVEKHTSKKMLKSHTENKQKMETKSSKKILQKTNIQISPLAYKKIRSNIFIDIKPLTGYENQACACKRPIDSNKLGCLDNCLNRMMYVECNPSLCPCGDRCSNQRIQKYKWCNDIELFKTSNRGYGVRTTKTLKSGELIMEYTGEVVTVQEFEKRSHTPTYNGSLHHYCLYVDRKCVIDARHRGSLCRFVNHSCAPNCVIQKWSVNGLGRMVLVAKPHNTNTIPAGTELTYDYNFTCFKGKSAQRCLCGSGPGVCRGYITTQNGNNMSCNNSNSNKNENNLPNHSTGTALYNVKNDKATISKPNKSKNLNSITTKNQSYNPQLKRRSHKKTLPCIDNISFISKHTTPNNNNNNSSTKSVQVISSKGNISPSLRTFSLRNRGSVLGSCSSSSPRPPSSNASHHKSTEMKSEYDIFNDIIREASSPLFNNRRRHISSDKNGTHTSNNTMGRTKEISRADVARLSLSAGYRDRRKKPLLVSTKNRAILKTLVNPSPISDIKHRHIRSPPKNKVKEKDVQQHTSAKTNKSAKEFNLPLPNTRKKEAMSKVQHAIKSIRKTISHFNKSSTISQASHSLVSRNQKGKDNKIGQNKLTKFIQRKIAGVRDVFENSTKKKEIIINGKRPATVGIHKPLYTKQLEAKKPKLDVASEKAKRRSASPCKQSSTSTTIERYWLFNFYLQYARTPLCLVTRLIFASALPFDKPLLTADRNSKSLVQKSCPQLRNSRISRDFGNGKRIFLSRTMRDCMIYNHDLLLITPEGFKLWLFLQNEIKRVQQTKDGHLDVNTNEAMSNVHEMDMTSDIKINELETSQQNLLKEIYLLVKYHQDSRIKEWKYLISPFLHNTSLGIDIKYENEADKEQQSLAISQNSVTCFKDFETRLLNAPGAKESSYYTTYKMFDRDFTRILQHFNQIYMASLTNMESHIPNNKKHQHAWDALKLLEELYVTITNARIHALRRTFPSEDIPLKTLELSHFPSSSTVSNVESKTDRSLDVKCNVTQRTPSTNFKNPTSLKAEDDQLYSEATLNKISQTDKTLITVANMETPSATFPIASEYKDSIDCQCRIFREEGDMIQCDSCSSWQHCECVGIYTPSESNNIGHNVSPLKTLNSATNETTGQDMDDASSQSNNYTCPSCLGKTISMDIKLYTAVVQDYDSPHASTSATLNNVSNSNKTAQKSAKNSEITQNSHVPMGNLNTFKTEITEGQKCHKLTYYRTMASLTRNFRIKCGECYYVIRADPVVVNAKPPTNSDVYEPKEKTSNRGGPANIVRASVDTTTTFNIDEMDVFKCLYLFTDESGKRWAQGHHFLRPSETYHEPSRKFYLNELLLVNIYETVPIESIYKPCWVLDHGTYCKGRPLVENIPPKPQSLKIGNQETWFTDLTLPDERDVYICQLKVDRKARKFDRASKFKYNCIQDSYCFHYYDQPLVPKRIYFPHEIPKSYAKSDPNLKFLRIDSVKIPSNATTQLLNDKPTNKSHTKIETSNINQKVNGCSFAKNKFHFPNNENLTPIFDRLMVSDIFKKALPNIFDVKRKAHLNANRLFSKSRDVKKKKLEDIIANLAR